MDDGDAVAVLCLVQVVGRDEHRRAILASSSMSRQKLRRDERIDAAGRLVQKDDGRFVQDGAPEAETLFPTTGERAGESRLASRAGPPSPARPHGARRTVRAAGRRCRRRRRCSDRRSASRREKTAETCSRCAVSRLRDRGSTSTPPTLAEPEEGRRSPHSIRIVVDLPAPLLPRKPKISPWRTSKLRSLTATNSPKRRVSRRTSIGFIDPAPWRAVPRQTGRRPARGCDRAPPGAARPRHRGLRFVRSRRRGIVRPRHGWPRWRPARRRPAAATAARPESISSRRWRTSSATTESNSASRSRAAVMAVPAWAASARARPPSQNDQLPLIPASHEWSHRSVRGKRRGFGRA